LRVTARIWSSLMPSPRPLPQGEGEKLYPIE
jgi:hypothetical protein